MLVREATAEDAPGIAEVHVASWRKVYRGVLKDETLDGFEVEQLAAEWKQQIVSPDTPEDRMWVLIDGDRVVGYSRTGPNRDSDVGDDVAEVYGFYTHPDIWGTGGGQMLMDVVLEDFHDRGFGQATLWVVDANPRARRFYEKHGWTHEPGPTNTCFGAPEVRYRLSSVDFG